MNDAPGRLLGRERELAAAAGAIAAVKDGGSRVLAVLGETGIGKSALLDALQRRAEAAGLLVLDGRAAEHERDVPFGLVIDALDDHVATLHPRRIESAGADLAAVLPAAAAGQTPAPPPSAPASASAATARCAPCSRCSGARSPSRCSSTTCTGPTTRRSSSSCTSCAAPRALPT